MVKVDKERNPQKIIAFLKLLKQSFVNSTNDSESTVGDKEDEPLFVINEEYEIQKLDTLSKKLKRDLDLFARRNR